MYRVGNKKTARFALALCTISYYGQKSFNVTSKIFKNRKKNLASLLAPTGLGDPARIFSIFKIFNLALKDF